MSQSFQTFINACIHAFFTLELNVKIYHWQTKSYARHKATDQFMLKFLPFVDQMIEVLLGIYPEVKNSLSAKLNQMPIQIRIIQESSSRKSDQDTIVKMSNELIHYLKEFESKGLTQTSVLNIRDSIVGEIQQMLYLFSFE